jgi:histidinol dehydrogenase
MNKGSLMAAVSDIMRDVKETGDAALKRFALEFDHVAIGQIEVRDTTINGVAIDKELEAAIQVAKSNIETFHAAQKMEEPVIETMPGVRCWRRSLPIERVGIYIPGGSAPLFSTVLMLAIPAKLAGCKEIILCTPPNSDGSIHPAILYAARLVGVDRLFKVGGAQAIAAMTYGTESIPRVDKIFGPGNQYVTMAKQLVQQDGIAIDMPAGPSEVLIIADSSAVPEYVAADLLSQAEHGADSQVILLTENEPFIRDVQEAIAQQLDGLPRADVARKALENSLAIVLDTLNDCMDWSNLYAPEHLILVSRDNDGLMARVSNAGSVFIGNFSCESAGDYASGTNHTLPTNGAARAYSGVSLDSFVKKVTFQEISAQGLKNIGPSIECMAEAEELIAHKNAVSIRLKDIQDV